MKKTSLLVLSLLLSVHTAGAATATDSGGRYDELVRRARRGDTTPVLEYLRRRVNEQTQQQQEDHIVIASWAGLNQETIAAYLQVKDSFALAPATLGSVARAYRNTRDYVHAAALYRQAQQKAPDDLQWVMGEMLSLSDGGHGRDAVMLGQAALHKAKAHEQAQLHTVMAYAWLAAGQRFDALNEIQQALQIEQPGPYDAELLERFSQVLSQAGMPLAALEVNAHLTPVQRLQMQANELALRVRMSDFGSRQEAERFMVADELLARYHSLLNQCVRTPGAEGVARQIRTDRLGVYKAREMYRDVINDYEQLAREAPVPAYVNAWVAEAYDGLRLPEQASVFMKQAIAKETPKDEQWAKDHLALIHSLLKADRPREARDEMTALLPTIPRYHWSLNYPLPHVNWEWLNTQLANTEVMQANGDEREAMANAKRLCELASEQDDPCLSYGGLIEGSGRPRDAEHYYVMVQAENPRGQWIETAQTTNALTLREWAHADVMARSLRKRYADYPDAKRALRANDVAHMAEFRLEASRGHSHADEAGSAQSAGNPVRGNDNVQIEGTLYSPRFGDHWRAYTGAGYTAGDFDTREQRTATDSAGNEVVNTRYGTSMDHGRWQRLGLEYTDRNTLATVDASRQRFGRAGAQPGARITLDRDINDSWHYGLLYAFRTTEAPLQARKQGIWATQADVHASWTPSDRTMWQVSLQPWHFSDGNQRWQASISGRQRLWTWPHVQLDGVFNVNASRNSVGHIAQDDDQVTAEGVRGANYYSPKRDLSVMPGLRLTQSLYSRYETQWGHYLEVSAGRYYEDYTRCDSQALCSPRNDRTPLWMARYGHRVRFNDVLDADASMQVTRQSYDGVKERDVQLLLDLNYRF